MPSKTLAQQTGNSCAAHCTAISIMELTGKTITKDTAEDTIWRDILFVEDGNEAVKGLVEKKNSDPRKIAKYIQTNHSSELSATIEFDDTQKAIALSFLKDDTVKRGLDGLYNLIKGQSGTTTVTPADDVYYNCSYLMMIGGDPNNATLDGLHNILVTSSGGQISYYNSNESNPCWTPGKNGWKLLENANGNANSYIFTGLCVAVQKK